MKCPKCGSEMELFSVSMGKGGREAHWSRCTNPECKHEDGRLVYPNRKPDDGR